MEVRIVYMGEFGTITRFGEYIVTVHEGKVTPKMFDAYKAELKRRHGFDRVVVLNIIPLPFNVG